MKYASILRLTADHYAEETPAPPRPTRGSRRAARSIGLVILIALPALGCGTALSKVVQSNFCSAASPPTIESPTSTDFLVPDQDDQLASGCAFISIHRSFSSDAERAMILAAENQPPASGSAWWDEQKSKALGVDPDGEAYVLVPAVVGTEALTYYATRISDSLASFRPFREGAVDETALTYTADVQDLHSAAGPATGAFVVRLNLKFSEGHRRFFGVYGYGKLIEATRTLVMDQSANVIGISGDGLGTTIVLD